MGYGKTLRLTQSKFVNGNERCARVYDAIIIRIFSGPVVDAAIAVMSVVDFVVHLVFFVGTQPFAVSRRAVQDGAVLFCRWLLFSTSFSSLT